MTIEPLLEFIAKLESNGDYNRIWSGIKKAHYPPKPLTQMTIGGVLEWQRDIRSLGYRSTAAGAFQIIRKTLSEFCEKLRGFERTPFDKITQDVIGTHLLRIRGLDKYVSGGLTAEEFANSLAQEWASLPVVDGPHKGRSYYDKDGVNHALTTPDKILSVINQMKGN